MFEIYRIYLLLGLLAHKLIWELMKRNSPDSSTAPKAASGGLKLLLKWLKILSLVFILLQTIIPYYVFPITDDPKVLRLVGLVIYTIGLAIAIIGRLQLGKNWANIEDYQVLLNQNLVNNGIYRYIRHPIYSGDLLLICGLELSLNSWLVLMVIPLAIYIFWQARVEEKMLLNAFPNYGMYQSQTKMFIPFVI